MSNKKAQTIIKELALQAKQRLKNLGYGIKEEDNEIKNSLSKKNNLKFISNMSGKKSEAVIKIINDNEDEEKFNRRVYALLSEDIDTTTPLKQLCDATFYENFSQEEQEKYILELSDRYTKVREQYLRHYGY